MARRAECSTLQMIPSPAPLTSWCVKRHKLLLMKADSQSMCTPASLVWWSGLKYHSYGTPTIPDELLGFLIAGHETTSSSLQWAIKLLADNQEAQSRLRDRLHKHYPDASRSKRAPSAEEIARSSIPYLDATVEEIMRMALTAPIAVRRAKIDTVLLGYHIPKDTEVYFMMNGPELVVAGHITKLNARSDGALPAGTPVTITAVLSATSVQVARRG